MQPINKKHAAAGAALIFAGVAETLATGVPCPLCIGAVGSGIYTIKQSVGL
ncbi:MAG TPA: hypothetical protein VJH24_05740 [Candidatus Bilamarchaeaceae archaeon]|nr:hypothetical protein [Candidatus Bilamarchaeaceae archaeon]